MDLKKLKKIPSLIPPLLRGARGDLFLPYCFQVQPGKKGDRLLCKILGLIKYTYIAFSFSFSVCLLLAHSSAWSAPQPKNTPNAADLDLSPKIIENSPVLQRWLRQVPNVLDEIANDPSFRTRLRLGYSLFPSTNAAGGVNIGVEDLFISRSGFTISGEYQTAFNAQRQAYGANLNYYVRPLGSFVNLALVLGFRHLETDEYSTDGVNIGAKLLLVLSRGGAADISLTQTWVSPGTDEEVGLTTLSFGYAITHNLRLSTDIQRQHSKVDKDSRVGIVLEWMP